MRRFSRFVPVTGVAVALSAVLYAQGPAAGSQGQAATEPNPQLLPTVHAALPENVDDFWFAPRPAAVTAVGNTALADAAMAYNAGNHPAALAAARQAVAAG